MSPRGNKRANTRRKIIAAAGNEFAAGRYDKVTIDSIAKTAGVSVGTIFSHFGDKDGLALAYLSDRLDALEAAVAAARASESPTQRVVAAGQAYIGYVVENPAAARIATMRASYPASETAKSELATSYDRRIASMLLQIAGDLQEAMRIGEIRSQPIEETMLFLWGTWNGVASLTVRGDGLKISQDAATRALNRGQQILCVALGQAA